MFVLIVAGIPLERCFGTCRMALMFNAGILGGTLCYFVSDPHVDVVGMSGACFALQSIHLAKLLTDWHRAEFRLEKLVFLIGLTIAQFIHAQLTWNSSSSHSIHFGGYVAGLCIGVLVGESQLAHARARKLRATVLLLSCIL